MILVVSIIFAGVPLVNAQPVTTELGISIDGSGSIDAANFQIMIDGLAAAIRISLPADGSVELTVVQFCYWFGVHPDPARIEYGPTVIDSAATREAAAQTIELITQMGDPVTTAGRTPTADGLILTWQTMKPFVAGAYQVINLCTNGYPNEPVHGPIPSGWGTPPSDPYDAAEWVRANAVNEGLDELDAEGIGVSQSSYAWLKDDLVWPKPGTSPPPYEPGWAQWIQNWGDFPDAIVTKIVVVTGPVVNGVIPEYPFGTILGLVTMLAALVVTRKFIL